MKEGRKLGCWTLSLNGNRIKVAERRCMTSFETMPPVQEEVRVSECLTD